MMRTILIAGGFAGLVLAAGGAQAAPPGTYEQSCRAIRDVGRNGLEAECRDRSGRFRYSRLNLSTCDGGDIGNDNGQLVCAPRPGGPGNGGGNGDGWGGGRPGGGGALPGGSWRQSCRGGDISRGTLSAVCETNKGRKRETSIRLNACPTGRFGNYEGRLVCE